MPAHALRCGTKLVDKGDTKFEVLSKCGDPALIEQWQGKKIITTTSASSDVPAKKERLNKQKRSETREHSEIEKRVETEELHVFEEWTYNFGASHLLYYLTFENGKLIDYTSGDHGYDDPVPANSDRTNCAKMIAIGDRKINVLMKCGEPSMKDSRVNERITSLKDRELEVKLTNKIQKITDEWSYNFGPNHFLLFIEFENGRVVNFNQRGYGF